MVGAENSIGASDAMPLPLSDRLRADFERTGEAMLAAMRYLRVDAAVAGAFRNRKCHGGWPKFVEARDMKPCQQWGGRRTEAPRPV